MNQLTINNKEIQFEKQGEQIFCTSLDIAEVFEKEHKNVLRDIDNILEDLNDKDFAKLNFELCEYNGNTEVNNGRKYRYFKLTRDGFSILAMGFIGKKALEWKVSFINAFNQMEQMLKNQNYNENTLQLTQADDLHSICPLSIKIIQKAS